MAKKKNREPGRPRREDQKKIDEAIARAIARAGDKTYTYTQIASDAGVSVSAISRYFQRIRGDRS